MYSSYDIYLNDLSNANKNNYSNELKNTSMSLNFGIYRRWSDSLIMGGNLITGTHDIEITNITNKSYESTNSTQIGYTFLAVEGLYFFNKIYNDFYIKGGIGPSNIIVSKDNNKGELKSTQFGLGTKLGVGYAFNINPNESAVLIGLDSIYLNSYYKDPEGQKKTFSLINISLYASILW